MFELVGRARCIAPLVKASATTASAGAPDRWILNTGTEVILTVPDLSPGTDPAGDPLPIRAVVDLTTLKAASQRIVALRDHETKKPIGSFVDFDISVKHGVQASLEIAKPTAEGALIDAREITDLLAAKVPLQASIGAEPGPTGHWERIADGVNVTVNGRTFQGGGTMPLYVLRGGLIFESSVVTFGADDDTGRLAATRTTATAQLKDPAMTDAAALLAPLMAKAAKMKYPEKRTVQAATLVAAGKASAEIMLAMDAADGDDAMAAITAERDAAMARAEAAEKECKAIKAKYEAADAHDDADEAKKAADAAKATAAAAVAAAKTPAELDAAARALADARTAAARAAQSGTEFRDSTTTTQAPATITAAMDRLAKEGLFADKPNRGTLLHAEAIRRWPTAARL